MNLIRKSILLYLLLIVASISIQAQDYFDYNEDIQEAYQAIIELRFDNARILLDEIEEKEPNNLARLHIANYIDFFTIFINEDEDEYKRLKQNQKKRINRIHDSKVTGPFKLFASGEINLQWAITRSKFGEQIPVLRDLYSAYRSLKENQEKYPAFQENKKSLSVIHAVNETIPIPKFLKRLFSLEGSIERGETEILEMLEYAEENNSMFYPEALASYAVITLYQRNDKQKAFNIIKQSNLKPANSPLVGFLFAKIAQRAGYNEEAIAYLEACPSGPEYKSFEYLDFLLGLSYTRKLDPRAKTYLKKFVSEFHGRLYIKEAYQKLAWCALVIDDNVAEYKKYIALADKFGTNIVDDDKQAQKEADDGIIPNPEILKARLLYDGGYYQRAHNILIKNAHRLTYDKDLNLEYYYRLGRVTQALNNYPDAIVYFSQTIDKGRYSGEYFACNAALQIGNMFESQGNLKSAKKYFKLCLEIEPDKYQTSLHQKAKAGLDRIKL